jgi:hypothetical protein
VRRQATCLCSGVLHEQESEPSGWQSAYSQKHARCDEERKEAECAFPNEMRIQIQGQQYDLLNVVVGNFNEKDEARPLWPAQCI